MNKIYMIILLVCIFQVKADFREKNKVRGADYKVEKVHIVNDNTIIAGLENSTSLIYDENFSVLSAIEQGNKLSAVDWKNDLLVVACASEQAKLYNTNSWENIFSTSDNFYTYYTVSQVGLTNDGKYMAVGAHYYIDMLTSDGGWSMGQMLSQDQYTAITGFAFSRDDQWFVSASGKSTNVRKRNGDNWENDHVIQNNGNAQAKVAFSDNYCAISQHDNEVHIYKVADWTLETILTIPNEMTGEVSFDKDAYLAVATTNKVYIYKVGSWEQKQVIDFPDVSSNPQVMDIHFSDSRLAVGYHHGTEGTVALYDESSSALKMMISVVLFAMLALLF